jgi:GT2 family glycosyltransferase
MNCSIFIVNYNADDHVSTLIKSLNKSLNGNNTSNININIIDNSKRNQETKDHFRKTIDLLSTGIHIHSDGTNKGYFGGLSVAQSLVKDDDDCIIYCNPDILVEGNFFQELEKSFLNNTAGIIAPSIICQDEGFDQNPMYLKRISAKKLKFLKFIFSNNLLYQSHTAIADLMKTAVKRFKKPIQKNMKPLDIYAPHGSMFIFFNVDFFKNLPNYPCFLFGEELFVAEEARKENVKIQFSPNVRVIDIRHASISKMDPNYLRELTIESIRFILNTYYQ